jgi:hypothetical protein
MEKKSHSDEDLHDLQSLPNLFKFQMSEDEMSGVCEMYGRK